MKYTKEQLEAMSGNEVNLALAKELYKENAQECIFYGFNYEEWDCIMPLAVEYNVAIAPNGESWTAFTLQKNWQVVDMQCTDKSPQRAIACCLLMMELNK